METHDVLLRTHFRIAASLHLFHVEEQSPQRLAVDSVGYVSLTFYI